MKLYLQNLCNYLEVDFKENIHKYEKTENKINQYIKNNLYLLYDFQLNTYLDYKILKKYNDKNFLNLCTYFYELNKIEKIVKNNTQFQFVHKKDLKLIFLLFTQNFIYYINYNTYINKKFNIFFDIEDEFTFKIIYPIKKICKNNYKILTQNFCNLSENIILFIQLIQLKYNHLIIPFDLIIYMLLGHQKFTHLFY